MIARDFAGLREVGFTAGVVVFASSWLGFRLVCASCEVDRACADEVSAHWAAVEHNDSRAHRVAVSL